MFANGDVVDGQYKIVGSLSEGDSGFGDVYLVKNEGAPPLTATKPEPMYAMKILRQLDAESRELFKREYHILRWATNENCQLFARFYDSGVVKGRPYFVMEYVKGGTTVRQLLSSANGGINPRDVRDTLERLLDGLEFVHQRHICHRDIKPENLMICGEQLKILDLGIAKYAGRHVRLLDEGVSEDRRTHKGGTPPYMAPEQFGETEHAGPTTDLYQVGLLGYEMFTGQHALVGDDRRSWPESWSEWHDLHRAGRMVPFEKLTRVPRDEEGKKFEEWLKKLIRPLMKDRLPSARKAFEELQLVFRDPWKGATEAEAHCPYCGHRNSRAKDWMVDDSGRLICCRMCGKSWVVWTWQEKRSGRA